MLMSSYKDRSADVCACVCVRACGGGERRDRQMVALLTRMPMCVY